MRTTVDIDEPVLLAIKSLAHARQQSMGRIISDLLIKGMARDTDTPATRNGIPLLEPADELPVTLELVNQLRDD